MKQNLQKETVVVSLQECQWPSGFPRAAHSHTAPGWPMCWQKGWHMASKRRSQDTAVSIVIILLSLPLSPSHVTCPGEKVSAQVVQSSVERPRGEDWGPQATGMWVPHLGAVITTSGETLNHSTQPSCSQILNFRNYVIINVCCFKLLSLGQFITQQ